MHTTLRLATLAIVLAGPTWAQRFLVTQSSPATVHLVDVQAGPLFDYGFINVASQPVGQLWDAAPVGAEIWVTGTQGIARFDALTLAPVGTIPGALGYTGLQPVSDGAWVTRTSGFLEKFDLAGNSVLVVAASQPLDVFLFNGELLVSNGVNSSIERYDLAGQFLGPLTQPFLGASIDFLGFGFLAERPSNGNLLLVANLRIYELDAVTGALLQEYQAGNFEFSVVELADRRLLSVNAGGATIFDPAAPVDFGTVVPTTESRSLRYVSPYDAGAPGLQRFCTAGPNSVGNGALVSARGTTRIADDSLWLDAVYGPAGTFGLFVYGNPGSPSVFGGGELCLSPFTPGVVRTDTLGTFDATGGRLAVELPYTNFPAAAPVVAGSTWAFQYVYRDPAGPGAAFNATDAIALTFD